MPAYVMAHVHSTNFGQEIIDYLRNVDATMRPFGGEFLVHGGPVETVEGTWSGDLIIIEFPDLDKARGWYERAKEMGSPEGPRRLEMLANR